MATPQLRAPAFAKDFRVRKDAHSWQQTAAADQTTNDAAYKETCCQTRAACQSVYQSVYNLYIVASCVSIYICSDSVSFSDLFPRLVLCLFQFTFCCLYDFGFRFVFTDIDCIRRFAVGAGCFPFPHCPPSH